MANPCCNKWEWSEELQAGYCPDHDNYREVVWMEGKYGK